MASSPIYAEADPVVIYSLDSLGFEVSLADTNLTGCTVETEIGHGGRVLKRGTVVVTNAAAGELSVEYPKESSAQWVGLTGLESRVIVTTPDGFRSTYVVVPVEVKPWGSTSP